MNIAVALGQTENREMTVQEHYCCHSSSIGKKFTGKVYHSNIPKSFKLFSFSIFLPMRVSDEGYSRNAPCTLT